MTLLDRRKLPWLYTFFDTQRKTSPKSAASRPKPMVSPKCQSTTSGQTDRPKGEPGSRPGELRPWHAGGTTHLPPNSRTEMASAFSAASRRDLRVAAASDPSPESPRSNEGWPSAWPDDAVDTGLQYPRHAKTALAAARLVGRRSASKALGRRQRRVVRVSFRPLVAVRRFSNSAMLARAVSDWPANGNSARVSLFPVWLPSQRRCLAADKAKTDLPAGSRPRYCTPRSWLQNQDRGVRLPYII